MGVYRISRNCEKSIIDRIKEVLALCSFTGVSVEKTFAQVYKTAMPVICVRVGDTDFPRVEIGTNSIVRNIEVFIDFFTKTDGLRLDLKDCLTEYLKRGINYYEYVIADGAIASKILSGRLRVSKMTDTIVNVNVEKNTLDSYDRYRHLITLVVDLGTVEV